MDCFKERRGSMSQFEFTLGMLVFFGVVLSLIIIDKFRRSRKWEKLSTVILGIIMLVFLIYPSIQNLQSLSSATPSIPAPQPPAHWFLIGRQ